MISTQFLQNCQAGDEEAIETLVRTHQRGVFQLALSILDDAPLLNSAGEAGMENGQGSAAQVNKLAAISISEAAAEAELATFETFNAALDRLGHYREDIPFTLWLYGIALEVTRRRKRRWKLRQWWQNLTGKPATQGLEAFSNQPLSERHGAVPEPPAFLPGDMEMWSAVRSLDEKLRIPVVLHYYHEFPIDQIALLMHLSEGAVHARLDAAREKIGKSLENSPRARS
jgi:DNA-directed RNA polymerase specialized sigma24 family protein